jgi:hypothetical protein
MTIKDFLRSGACLRSAGLGVVLICSGCVVLVYDEDNYPPTFALQSGFNTGLDALASVDEQISEWSGDVANAILAPWSAANKVDDAPRAQIGAEPNQTP